MLKLGISAETRSNRQNAGGGQMLAVRFVATAVFVILLSHTPIDARPIKPSFGCSMKQIQSEQAAPCIGMADQDILKGRSYTHVVRCSGGKLQCCKADNATSQIIPGSCGLSLLRQGGVIKPVGTTLQRSKQTR
jgi:hypothetical protein